MKGMGGEIGGISSVRNPAERLGLRCWYAVRCTDTISTTRFFCAPAFFGASCPPSRYGGTTSVPSNRNAQFFSRSPNSVIISAYLPLPGLHGRCRHLPRISHVPQHQPCRDSCRSRHFSPSHPVCHHRQFRPLSPGLSPDPARRRVLRRLFSFVENLHFDHVQPPLLHWRIHVSPTGESRGNGKAKATQTRVTASERGSAPAREGRKKR